MLADHHVGLGGAVSAAAASVMFVQPVCCSRLQSLLRL